MASSIPALDPETRADDECRDWSDLDTQLLPPLPQRPHTALLEAVWVMVLENHYDPTLNCVDWPALRLEYGAALAEVEDDAAARRVIREMLGRLGQSHFELLDPQEEVASAPGKETERGGARAPIDVRVIEGEAVVVHPSARASRSGIPGGAALLAVDDHEVGPLLAMMSDKHPRVIRSKLEVRRVIDRWLRCPLGAKKRVRYQVLGAREHTTRIVKCRPLEGERVSEGKLEQSAIVEHHFVPGTTIGYVSFNIWMSPVLARVERAIHELREQGMTALVVDLRGNRGGVGSELGTLGRQLLAGDLSFGAMRTRRGELVFVFPPASDPFVGSVVVLIDERTASTSEVFAQTMQDLGRATVVGASTSRGAALPSTRVELPGGAMLQYVVADYRSPAGVRVEGVGVQPDVMVAETRKDYAEGRDPVLEAAVAVLAEAPGR